MSRALYEPGQGYYARPETEIGRAGDFYTSPHLHSAFGGMLAKLLLEIRPYIRSREFSVIEQGPGKGLLSKDILDHLKGKEIYERLRYYIIEINFHLREKQKELLKEHQGKITWTDSLSSLKGKSLKGALISNELLDAFPVHVVEMTEEGLKEVFVGVKDDIFEEILAPPSTPLLEEYLKEFAAEGLPVGYRTEVNLELKNWIKDVSDILEGGFIATIDYGYPAWEYYSPERSRGTLLSYYKHQVTEDFYAHIGERDLTAHVNFSALKKYGEEVGFRCLGYTRQGTYLVSAGIDELMAGLDPFEVAKIKGLILPVTMGETHKIIIQYRGPENPRLKGFALRNEANKL
jgi:SAM-dependent MidA family methyltransferase